MQRALCSAGFQAVREPVELNRDDGKRPDGMTRLPWCQGKSLIWDVTVVDTFAESHIGTTSITACSAADKAEDLKRTKYAALCDRYDFAAIGIETLGSLGSEAMKTLNRIGQQLADQSGEKRSTCFLLEKISIELQRGNACSVLGTFKETRGLEELFYILKP